MKHKRLALYFFNVWIGLCAGACLIAHGLSDLFLLVAILLVGLIVTLLVVR